MKLNLHVAFTVAFSLALFACSENKTDKEYIEAGAKFAALNDYNSAIVEYKNAAKLAPRNPVVRFELGYLYVQQGNYIASEKELERALSLGFDTDAILPLLIEVKSKLNKPEQVYDLVKQSTSLSDEDYVLVLTYAGITALKSRETAKAQDYFSQAINVSEEAYFSQIAQAYLAQSKENYTKGLSILENVLANDNVIPEAVLMKGHLLSALGSTAEASQIFEYYLTLRPKDHYVRFFKIRNLIDAGAYEDADKSVDELLSIFEDSQLGLQYKAEIKYQQDDFVAAKTLANRSMQLGNKSVVVKLISGLSAYRLDDTEQAFYQLKSIESYLPAKHPAKRVLAVLSLKLGYIDEATDSFANLEGSFAQDKDLLIAASIELSKLDQIDKAKALLTDIDKKYPADPQVLSGKGLLELKLKDVEGIVSLEKALAADPNLIDIEIALALQYLTNNETAKAQKIADKVQENEETKADGLLLQGVIHSKNNKDEAAKIAFGQVLELDPENISAKYNLAVYEEKDSNFESAKMLYQEVLIESPEHTGSLNKLTGLGFKTEKVEDVVNFLNNLIEKNPLILEPRLTLANIYRMTNKTELAIKLLEGIPTDAILTQMYWLVLGDNYLQNTDTEKAKATYIEGLTNFPTSYLLNLRVIGLLEQLNDHENGYKAVTTAYQRFPGDVRLQLVLVNYLIKNNELDKAKENVVEMQEKGVNHTLLNYAKGQIALIEKQYENAIENFNIVYESQPTDQVAINLARALKFNGQQSQAEVLLENQIQLSDNPLRIRVLLAGLYSDKHPEKAILHYQNVLEAEPDNPYFLNNLAWAQYRVGNLEPALVNSHKAYTIVPDNLAIIKTYGTILAKSDQKTKAKEVLGIAREKDTSDEEINAIWKALNN